MYVYAYLCVCIHTYIHILTLSLYSVLGAMVSIPACGTKVAALKQFLAANQRPPGHRWKNLTEQTALHARRLGWDATHTQDKLTVRVNPDGSLRLRGDVCHPGVHPTARRSRPDNTRPS